MAESPGGIDERSADRLRYPGRKRVLGFVGVQTGFGNGKRRAMLRETWFPATPEEHARVEAETGLVFRFIIGHSTSEEDEQLLQAENSTHGDFLRIDVDESYLNLNQKTLVYFTYLFKLYEAEFYVKADMYILYEAEHYVKADDDIFLMPDRLSSLIARPRESPRTYLGCFKKGYVITNPKKKWFEPQAWLLGSEYFKYASGSIYSLSYDVVKILNFLPKGWLRVFVNEDASVGAWMLAFNVSHQKAMSLCQTSCTPTAVAIWDTSTESDLLMPPPPTPVDAATEAAVEFFADPPRGTDGVGLRGRDEGDTPRGTIDADARGMNDADAREMNDERGADRLQYPGRKRVLGFVGVQTGFKNRRKRALLRETWFPGTPEEHARVEAALDLVFRFIVGHSTSAEEKQRLQVPCPPHPAPPSPPPPSSVEAELGLAFRFIVGHSASAEEEQMLQAENSTHGDLLRVDVDEGYLNLNHKT
ncbi:unnamed protein product [Closterium sp. NIES-53]